MSEMTVIFVGFEVVGALGPRTPICNPATGFDSPVPARLRRCGAGKGNFNGFGLRLCKFSFLVLVFPFLLSRERYRGGQVGDFDGCRSGRREPVK